MDFQTVDTGTILKNIKNLISFTWNAAENAQNQCAEMDAGECATIMELLANMVDNLDKSIKADADARASECYDWYPDFRQSGIRSDSHD